MKIRKVKHKALRRFIEHDDASGLSAAHVEKIRNMISFLQEMDDPEEVRAIPGWRAHQLSGKRRDTWSLAVTRNWRITYRVDMQEEEIFDLNYEDYH